MIRGLAIETSGRMGSIALTIDGVALRESEFPHGLQHAARIIPAIDELCREYAWKPADLREIYVSAGPGSFTGLRIGVTLAKTLAFVTGAKLVAVPSVRVLVENAPAEARHVVIVLDAKREQIFTASFERASEESASNSASASDAKLATDAKPPSDAKSRDWILWQPARLDSLANVLAASPRPVYLLGDGVPYHEKFIPRDDPGILVCGENLRRARATATAVIGRRMARAGEFTEPQNLTPIYIRRPEAEEKFEAAGH
jgi:tRNA threonylcarbamoyladenosine biosynthesis protein TsaB